jgi:hypothetical protein
MRRRNRRRGEGRARVAADHLRSEYRPPWIGTAHTVELVLPPLSRADSSILVQSAIQGAELASDTTELILGKGDGNPFFLEELARTVLEPGMEIRRAVPDTIQDVLMARIDRLPDESKWVLQSAAVLGREFPLHLLDMGHPDRASLARHLQELVAGEFLHERTGAEEPFYAFKDALTQEVAYAGLLTARRQALHEAAGEALERVARAGSRDRGMERTLQGRIRSGPASSFAARPARRSPTGAERRLWLVHRGLRHRGPSDGGRTPGFPGAPLNEGTPSRSAAAAPRAQPARCNSPGLRIIFSTSAMCCSSSWICSRTYSSSHTLLSSTSASRL